MLLVLHKLGLSGFRLRGRRPASLRSVNLIPRITFGAALTRGCKPYQLTVLGIKDAAGDDLIDQTW